MAHDPIHTLNGTIPSLPLFVHTEAHVGYPSIRRPNLALLTRPASGLTWSQTDTVHPVPVVRTARFRRLQSG